MAGAYAGKGLTSEVRVAGIDRQGARLIEQGE
jgi:hypothetical protein